VVKSILIILYALTVLGVVIVVIAENRNPLKSIAWVAALILTPGVGLLAYLLFGQDNRKERIISRRTYRRIMRGMHYPPPPAPLPPLPPAVPSSSLLSAGAAVTSADFSPLLRLLHRIGSAPPLHVSDNDITIFTCGEDHFDALLADIAHAERHIHLEYYVFNDDAIGLRVRYALIAAARRGLSVRVLYDDVGSWAVSRGFFRDMKEAGIHVHSFLHVAVPFLYSKVNYRNHRKIAVIDGRIGYIGGMNIADRYHRGLSWGPWRDTQLRLVGQAVHGLQSAFLVDWHVATRRILTPTDFFPLSSPENMSVNKEGDEGGEGGVGIGKRADCIQIAIGGPTGHWRILLQATIRLITAARRYVFIQTPYFLPTESLNQALQVVALSGVDVRLMLPKRSDVHAVHLAGRSYLADLLRAGVKVYFYESGFLHAKVIIVDDAVTCVGSANMDFRSFEHNFEVNAYIYAEAFARRMRRIFEDDQTHSSFVSPSVWLRRPRRERFFESFCRLFSPLM
jgi:cardiolipin synthase